MHLGNDNFFNIKHQNDSLLFSPEKPDIDAKLNEDSNFISALRNHHENFHPFNPLNEKKFHSEVHEYNHSDSLSHIDHNMDIPIKTTILKLDFLQELLKDDIEIKSKQNLLKSLSFQFSSPINNLKHFYSSNLT